MYSKAIRVSGLAAILGGTMLTVYAVGVASAPRGCIGNEECAIRPMRDAGVFEFFLPLALPLVLAGMMGLALRARRTGCFGRLGWAGVISGSAGVVTLIGAVVVQAAFFDNDFQLMPYFVIPGGFALLLGFALVGLAVLRSGALPRGLSALLVASTVVMFGSNDQNAQILLMTPFALVWMAVGYILWSGEGDTARRPASAERMESVT